MLDDLDRALIHALHLDGRAPFSRIAGVLGVSAQTVARRYRRLRTEAGPRAAGALFVDMEVDAGLFGVLTDLARVRRPSR